jgi:transcriptional regulator with XRE-family HTH domain
MDNSSEVREFLTSRRARVGPDQVGLPGGSNRRVAGLRRSEVAILADVSVEYYARLERGNLAGASDAVLDAIARALQLDDAERAHLFDLAKNAAGPAIRSGRRPSRQWTPRPSLQFALDAITTGPAFVRNGRMDFLAANRLGFTFYSDLFEDPQRPANLARFNFLDLERSQRFYRDWSLAADTCVAILRTEAGRDPFDKALQDLIGELSTRSNEFRIRWGAHNVRQHGSGMKDFRHPVVGDVTLVYEGMELTADPGLSLLIYSAEPGSPSAEALQLLSNWAATGSTLSAASREPATE